jgi:hypothetical protein
MGKMNPTPAVGHWTLCPKHSQVFLLGTIDLEMPRVYCTQDARRALHLSGGSGDNVIPCLFQLLEAIGIPWHVTSSSIFKVHSTQSPYSSLSVSLRSFCFLLALLRTPWLFWAHHDNPECALSLLPCRLNSQAWVRGIPRLSGGGHLLVALMSLPGSQWLRTHPGVLTLPGSGWRLEGGCWLWWRYLQSWCLLWVSESSLNYRTLLLFTRQPPSIWDPMVALLARAGKQFFCY